MTYNSAKYSYMRIILTSVITLQTHKGDDDFVTHSPEMPAFWKRGTSLVLGVLLCSAVSPAYVAANAFANEAAESYTADEVIPAEASETEEIDETDEIDEIETADPLPSTDEEPEPDPVEDEADADLPPAPTLAVEETSAAVVSSTTTPAPEAASDAVPASEGAPDTPEEPTYPQWSYSGSTDYVRYPSTLNTSVRKLIAAIGEPARQIAGDNDLYASVMIAQAIVASNSGSSHLAKSPNFNLFGLKGNYQGESVIIPESADNRENGPEAVGAAYRKYPSYQASLEDFASVFTEKMPHYYQGIHKSVATSYEEACTCLQGRYSTEADYAETLIGLIEDYDLTRYDEPLDYELTNTYLMPAVSDAAAEALGNEPAMEERTLVDLVTEVTSHLGEDYVWGGETCGSFDCSGLVGYAYRHALGVEIPRTTHYQCLEGEDVNFADLHAGDLVFFADSKGVCVHVGMYLGEGCYIEAPHTGDVVKITTLEEKQPTFAKRLLKTQPVFEPQPESEL